MIRGGLGLVLATMAIGLTGVSGAAGEEGTIDLRQVPVKARRAAARVVPGARWTDASKDVDEGELIYELEGVDARGRQVAVEVTPEGQIQSISVEISWQSVPKVVLDALRKSARGFRPTLAMSVTEGKRITEYCFEGRDTKGEEIEVTVSADGSKVEIDD
jgi:hypothetical protein